MTAVFVVTGTFNDFCYKVLRIGGDWDDPTQIVDMWAFENLLGAMYLQMH